MVDPQISLPRPMSPDVFEGSSSGQSDCPVGRGRARESPLNTIQEAGGPLQISTKVSSAFPSPSVATQVVQRG